MSHSGPTFYDDDRIFAIYMARRQGRDNPNDTLEKPILLELAGELAGLRILDLGCGDAAFGRAALEAGCQAYVGIEGSRNMVAAAQQTLAGTAGVVIHATIEAWDYPKEAFDLIISRLALHYVETIELTFAQVYRTLAGGGRFVFSVEHPLITSCDRGWAPGTPRQDWIVDNYFETGPRATVWLGGTVTKYHRTVEDYFAALRRAGFAVEDVREARPDRAWFASEETYNRRKRIPLFLFMAGEKAAKSWL